MYYNPFSRRYFLRGAGLSLALPFLPSIMKNAYAATASPLRFIQIMNAYGQFPDHFFPTTNPSSVLDPSGIKGQLLSTFPGDVSPIFGSAFTPFKNKFSLLRGLSVMTSEGDAPRHNSSLGSCSSGTSSDNNESSPPIFPYSVDTIISESSKIYPSAVGIQRLVNFSAGKERYPNFSWNRINGSIQQMANTRDTSALLSKFAPLNGKTTAPPSSASQQRNYNIMQGVYADYKATRDNPQLATSCKNNLEAYMTLISQVQQGLQTQGAPITCGAVPPSEPETNVDAMIRNQTNILVAAMACQLTRVGAMALSIGYDPYHGYVHSDGYNKPGYLQEQIVLGKHVAHLMSQLDMISEGGGTALDNSIIYWGNEFGENLTSPNTGDNAHSSVNMPVFVAGGGAGALKMGSYIDYRPAGGRPLNNLMVSFFNAMGLSSSDYERAGVIGFGEYDASAAKRRNFAAFLTTAERRKGLPSFYTGNDLG